MAVLDFPLLRLKALATDILQRAGNPVVCILSNSMSLKYQGFSLVLERQRLRSISDLQLWQFLLRYPVCRMAQ